MTLFLYRDLLDQFVMLHVEQKHQQLYQLMNQRYQNLYRDVTQFVQDVTQAINQDSQKQQTILKTVYEDYQHYYVDNQDEQEKSGNYEANLDKTLYETKEDISSLLHYYNDKQAISDNFMLDIYQLKNSFLAFEEYLKMNNSTASQEMVLYVFKYQELFSQVDSLNSYILTVCDSIIVDQLSVLNQLNHIIALRNLPKNSDY